MPTFTLADRDASLTLNGEAPAIAAPYFDWSYEAVLLGHSIRATTRVRDHDPANFLRYFESLATDWKGWRDERIYESLERDIRIVAVHDRVRAVAFKIRLRATATSGEDWSAEQTLVVEPVALEQFAVGARAFAPGQGSLSPNKPFKRSRDR
jgi:hypothetical protein